MAKLNQNQLLDIFNALKPELKKYEKGSIQPQIDIEGKYDLWTIKKVFAHGKMRNQVTFAALIVQSSYVGFYYMPIYCNPEPVTALIPPELLKCLKGKSCFHIKKVDEDMIQQVEAAMKIGYAQYKENGWV